MSLKQIFAADDQPVRTMDDLTNYLAQETRPGQEITLTLLCKDQERQVAVTLGERSHEP